MASLFEEITKQTFYQEWNRLGGVLTEWS